MLVFHRGWMKYILSDRGDCRGVSVMRGDCGGVTVDGFRDIPAGVYLWGSRQGRTETQAGVARIKDIVITVLSCRE